MITDQALEDFLQNIGDTPTTVIDLRITNGELTDITDWQLHFKRLSIQEMYNEYKFVINQLMWAALSDDQRLVLFDQVNQAVSVLVGNLRHSYQNQPGILDGEQQQALDTVLSIYYLGIIFYHVIWQRVAARPNTDSKKPLLPLFNRKSSNLTTTPIIQHCLYGIMLLLRQSLFEKYIGYRQDTQVIWYYLNAYYRFALTNEWQQLVLTVKTGYTADYLKNQSPLTLTDIYYHCLLMAIINPYACRRSDMLAIRRWAVDWLDDLTISRDLLEKPYVYIDLESNQPPQRLQVAAEYNPFSVHSNTLFIMFSRFNKRLLQVISQPTSDSDSQHQIRYAKLMYHNLQDLLEPIATLDDQHTQCEAVLGFQTIHYMLANKTSLSNLIYANELMERFKPRTQYTEQLNKYTVAELKQQNTQTLCISHVFSYPAISHDHYLASNYLASNRSVSYHPISQLQVNSLIAVKNRQQPTVWYLGYIKDIRQSFLTSPEQSADKKTHLQVVVNVNIHSQNAIACGVRLQNHGSRQPYFVPAFILPTDATYQHSQTSLLMARFGYQVDDRLIIRIDNKEIKIRLTHRLNLTDDIEEYAFVRLP